MRRRSRKSDAAADAATLATSAVAQKPRAIERWRRFTARSSLQLDVQQDADKVRAVTLRTAVGVDAMVDDLSIRETGVMPVVDMAAFVVIEHAQRDALDDWNRRANREAADVVRHRRKPVVRHQAIGEIGESNGRRECVARDAARINVIPAKVETNSTELLPQRRAGVVVSLLILGPPATIERIGLAAERRIAAELEIVDIRHVQRRAIVAVIDARVGQWRRLPFPLQRDADGVV